MPTSYVAAGWCYILSAGLDAFDGHAARALDQSTKFGAMLDQLTDRCATMALLATLCTFYPRWMFLFQLSMVIDISCHWIHLHASLMQVRRTKALFATSTLSSFWQNMQQFFAYVIPPFSLKCLAEFRHLCLHDPRQRSREKHNAHPVVNTSLF